MWEARGRDSEGVVTKARVIWALLSVGVMLGLISLGMKPTALGDYIVLWVISAVLLTVVIIPAAVITIGGVLLIVGYTYGDLTKKNSSVLWKAVVIVIALLCGLLWLLPALGGNYLEEYGL